MFLKEEKKLGLLNSKLPWSKLLKNPVHVTNHYIQRELTVEQKHITKNKWRYNLSAIVRFTIPSFQPIFSFFLEAYDNLSVQPLMNLILT